ncbi:MAG: GMC family oxidoreductase, partial [Ferruginibacter sp.]|nr:GMC family oxidoreductase [Ferruginibacter sp.]
LGIKTSPAANAALSANYYQQNIGWRKACTNRGFCQAGCSTGAKASMDVTFIPLAIHFGAEVRPECFVTSFERNSSGKISAVIYIKNGVVERQLCKNVFLCAGAIETPRLLLINNIANSNGMVGKNFMAHTGVQVWGEFNEMVRPNKGIPGALISEDMHRPIDADFAGGYLLQSIGVMPVTYAAQMARATGIWGQALRDKMSLYNHVAGINMHGECLPDKNNYLELSDEKDEYGLPKPRIYFSMGDNETKMGLHAENLMRKIWENAGAKNITVHQRMAHTIGTCRMSNNADTGVVDTECRSFEIENLFIADNAVFPGALSANPALTIMANSLRVADLFLQKK